MVWYEHVMGAMAILWCVGMPLFGWFILALCHVAASADAHLLYIESVMGGD